MTRPDIDRCNGVEVRTTIEVWRTTDGVWHAEVVRGGLTSAVVAAETRARALAWAVEVAA